MQKVICKQDMGNHTVWERAECSDGVPVEVKWMESVILGRKFSCYGSKPKRQWLEQDGHVFSLTKQSKLVYWALLCEVTWVQAPFISLLYHPSVLCLTPRSKKPFSPTTSAYWPVTRRRLAHFQFQVQLTPDSHEVPCDISVSSFVFELIWVDSLAVSVSEAHPDS